MSIKAAEMSIGFLLSSLLRLAEIKSYQVSTHVWQSYIKGTQYLSRGTFQSTREKHKNNYLKRK